MELSEQQAQEVSKGKMTKSFPLNPESRTIEIY